MCIGEDFTPLRLNNLPPRAKKAFNLFVNESEGYKEEGGGKNKNGGGITIKGPLDEDGRLLIHPKHLDPDMKKKIEDVWINAWNVEIEDCKKRNQNKKNGGGKDRCSFDVDEETGAVYIAEVRLNLDQLPGRGWREFESCKEED